MSKILIKTSYTKWLYQAWIIVVLFGAKLYAQQKERLPDSKYLKEAYEYLSVRNYTQAKELFEDLLKFKKDRPYATVGLLQCAVSIYDELSLEKIETTLPPTDPLKTFVSAYKHEFQGHRDEAYRLFETYKQQESRTYCQWFIQYADIALKRLHGNIEETEALIESDIKVNSSNMILEDFNMGSAWWKNSLYLHFNKPLPVKEGKLYKVDGYMGSFANNTVTGIQTKEYLGGISFDTIQQVAYVSKNEHEIGFTELNVKKAEKMGISKVGLDKLQLYTAQYTDNSISVKEKLPFCQSEYNYIHPVIFAKGKKMIFSSEMEGSLGGYDLYLVEKRDDGSWSIPVNLGIGINSNGDEKYPYIYNDSILYFSSNGRMGYGNYDLFQSVKQRGGRWSDAANMGKSINSGADEINLIQVSSRQGMFFSNRAQINKDQLYYFEFPIRYRKVMGTAKDKLYNQPLSGVDIRLYDGDTLLTNIPTNNDGKFAYNYLLEDKEYRLVAEKPGFNPVEVKIRPGNKDVFLDQLQELKLEPKIEKSTVFRFNNILFDYGKADLKEESKAILDRLAEVLLNNPTIKVELSAHTDTRSSHQFNMKLSQARAESCVRYLVAKGIKEQNIVARGYGKTRILNHCKDGVPCSEEEHLVNRRVEIKVLDIISN